jgi:hypothetical protein
MEIRPVIAKFFQADTWNDRRAVGRTDMTNLIVAFRNSANASNKLTKKVLIRVRLNDPLCYKFVCHQTAQCGIQYLNTFVKDCLQYIISFPSGSEMFYECY